MKIELYDPSKLETYRALTVDDPRVVMMTYLSWSLMCLGRFGEARCYSEEALAQARETAHAYTMAHAFNGAAFVSLTIDTPEAGLQRLKELRAVLADHGIAYYEAVEMLFRGYCLAAIGDFESALDLLTSGMAAYNATSSRLYLPGFLRMSAEAHCWAREHEVAMRLVTSAIDVMERTDQRWDEAEIYRVLGMILRATGDSGAARAQFQRACAVAHSQGAKLWELRAAMSLAQSVADGGAPEDAAAILEPVLGEFEDEPRVPDLRRAHDLLAALTREKA